MAYAKKGFKAFDLGNGYKASCHSERTRYGFRHVAALLNKYSNDVVARVAYPYYNRTWERYEYESVLNKLVDRWEAKSVTIPTAVAAARNAIKDYKEPNAFSAVAFASAVGELLAGDKPEDVVAWKKRMIATVPGISFPDNFDNLPIEEQRRRLDLVEKEMRS
jgi:hypothetical protein